MAKATERLVFYNGEGYPHNFRLNDGIWNGKIFYEPNSAGLFKSISMYVLESVPNIEYNGILELVNNELYNDLGMSIFGYTNENIEVTEIKAVNQSPDFYSKWIYGHRLNKLFPIGTMVSFSGNFVNDGLYGWDDLQGKYFNVLRTRKDAILITTDTSNNLFYWNYDKSLNDIKISSHNAVSVPGFKRNIPVLYDPDVDMKISIIGSDNNDGVVELSSKEVTMTKMYDYDFNDNLIISGTTLLADSFQLNIELLTERPMLYTGDIILSKEGSTLIMEFLNGRNSNLEIGDEFMVEDLEGNALLNSNFYTIEEILTEKYIGTEEIIFHITYYKDDDGQNVIVPLITYPNSLNLKLNDKVKFINTSRSSNNDNMVKRILSITKDEYTSTAKVDSPVYFERDQENDVYLILKDYQKNLVKVSSTIDFSTFPNLQPVRCMSTSNILSYNQDILIDSNKSSLELIEDSLDTFVETYNAYFKTNGIDLYRLGSTLYVEGMYSSQKPYFKSTLSIGNDNLPLKGQYSVSGGGSNDGDTNVHNFILKEGQLINERQNMTKDLARNYSAVINLDISDDIQDYGFQIELNGIQFYTEFIDNSGTTSYTYETILNFIEKYESIFNNNGFTLSSNFSDISGITTNTLYIDGQEPNVDVHELKVKVNKNSSYELTEIKNNRMMLVTNYIESGGFNFIDYGYTTSMILNVNGSSYPSNNNEYNIIGIHNNKIELSYQGAFYSESGVNLNIISKEYLRKPRESNEEDIYYRFRWENDIEKSIFFYDISGENLVPWGNNPKYKYKGVKPLNLENDIVILNEEPNKNEDYVLVPSKQQTIFNQLEFLLDRFDEDDLDLLPEPFQVFMGYKSDTEGVHEKTLIMERVDNVKYEGFSNGVDLYFTFNNNLMTIETTSNINLLDMGFKTNRQILIKMEDDKPYTQLLFENYQEFTIKDVTKKKIRIEGEFIEFSTMNEEFTFSIVQLPEKMGEFQIMGQTEIEDERLEANMKLLGIKLTEEDEYMFEESDINEQGTDYVLLNRKRKEMMENYKEIYDYIGSYRAIFNSLNFFGYEDIQLVEYYRNIDSNSPLYNKLKRVVIPDLMDRMVEGWSYSEELAKRIGYKKTNLFNLTYRITDEEGNNVNIYSLADVQYKLNGLKKWLRKNILPVNTNIRDITGVSESVGTNWTRYDPSVNIIDHKVIEKSTAVNYNYIATRNFNSSWLISIRFYTVNGFKPDAFDLLIRTYVIEKGSDVLKPQQEYNIMKTDLEPFNFTVNWEEDLYDMYFKIETTYYNTNGLGKTVNKMYRLEDKDNYYYDEKKNYTLVENNFEYKTESYVQNKDSIYILDEHGNYYIIDKNIKEEPEQTIINNIINNSPTNSLGF